MIPKTQEKLIRMIQRHEGLRLSPYKCTAGKLTIGYGRNLDAKGISNCEANMMLANDIKECLLQLQTVIPFWNLLSENRKIVLTDMCFQLGVHGLLKFKKMLLAMEYENWGKAAAEMLDSKWHTQTPKRCEELAELMREG